MERVFTVEEARAVLADIREQVATLLDVRAELATKAHAHNAGEEVSIPEIKALEAQMSEILDAIAARGAQIKGYAPLLLDFPAVIDGHEVLLCWLEGESELAWYHETTTGFMGRRPLDSLPGA